MTAGGDAPWAVVYDGECALCTRAVQRIRALDRDARFELVPWQTEGVRARFPEVPPAELERAVQLIRSDGARWHGAAAIAQILRVLPGARPITWLFRIPVVRPLARAAYTAFARRRHGLRCGAHCG